MGIAATAEGAFDETQTFEFLEQLEQNGNELPSELVQELHAFKADFEEHDGLIPSGSVPALLNVSQQRWSQLNHQYGFWSAKHFEKTWYSRRQIEDFYKVRRKTGHGGHNVSKVLKTLLPSGDK
jgi:hypothetical protein